LKERCTLEYIQTQAHRYTDINDSGASNSHVYVRGKVNRHLFTTSHRLEVV